MIIRRTLAICLISLSAAAADPARPKRDILRLGPKPPVERFPDAPYVAPPTPEEIAAAGAAREAIQAARAARRQAVSNLLSAVGIVEKPVADAKDIAANAAKIAAAAAAIKAKMRESSPVK